MNLHRLITISKKEFSDHIRSKKFLLILIILCIVLGLRATDGVVDYRNALQDYNDGGGYGIIFQPSPVSIFSGIVKAIGSGGLGIVTGLALGFDLISGEREGRSIKTILSQPIYRDELINGKAIGGIMALSLITLIAFIIVFAVMLILGIVPDPDEIIGIGIIWLITLLFIVSSFSLAIMTSVITNTGSESLILALIIIFILELLIPIGGSEAAGYLLLGQSPQEPGTISGSDVHYETYQKLNDEYNKNNQKIHEVFNAFSVTSVYNEITRPITAPSSYVIEEIGYREFDQDPEIADSADRPTIWSVMKDKWIKFVVFLMWPAVFFGIAYVRFMRSDLR